ncbi:hypothetical protein RJD24_12410 [Bacillaceae bacterium IKA-2]|nr:hypothetical protein RJD24_12410 [Bacillaceae bacterium IKA-2]
MKQKQIALILIIVLINVFSKSWKAIPKHYNSLLYVIFWNSFYYYICKRHLVYELVSEGFNWKWLRGIHIFVVTPLIVNLYLAKFPKSLAKQAVYTIKWVFGSFVFETFLHKQKLLIFKHGWNVFWSTVIYFKMYVYSYLLTKRPGLTAFLSLSSLTFFIVKFKVPLSKRLLKGPFIIFLPKVIKYLIDIKTTINSIYYEGIKSRLRFLSIKWLR